MTDDDGSEPNGSDPDVEAADAEAADSDEHGDTRGDPQRDTRGDSQRDTRDDPQQSTRDDSQQSTRGDYQVRLESLDRDAAALLAAVRHDDGLEEATVRALSRHLREVRAELESTRLVLGDLTHPTDVDGADIDADVPMIVHRSDLGVGVLGPDPVAYEIAQAEQDRASESGRDDGTRADDDRDDCPDDIQADCPDDSQDDSLESAADRSDCDSRGGDDA